MRRTIVVLAVLLAIVLVVAIIGYLLPAGHTATAQRDFDRSVSDVWSILTDVQRYPEWRPGTKGVEVLSSEGEALTWVETSPRNEKMTFRVTESIAPQRLVVTIADDLPFGGSWTYELQPVGAGCTVTITENGEVYNPIFRFVSRLFMDNTKTINVFLGDLAAASSGAPTSSKSDELDRLVGWMTGSFSSATQAQADTAYADIRLEMVQIWKERDDGRWLYVEQASASSPDTPYRQRVYRVHEPTHGSFVSDVYTIESPLRFAGAWRERSPLAALAPDSLTLRDGCSVYLAWREGTYGGSTRGSACPSELHGATSARSDVTIAEDEIQSWDRGFSPGQGQVWGATKGPYKFRRVD